MVGGGKKGHRHGVIPNHPRMGPLPLAYLVVPDRAPREGRRRRLDARGPAR
jgi:hypothetical protein